MWYFETWYADSRFGCNIVKYWNAIKDKYYSISSNFSNPAAITAASGTWNAVGGKVKLYYNFSSNTATDFIQNGKNEVFKLNAGESYLAQTTAYLNSNNKVVEFDIGLNTYVPWGNGDGLIEAYIKLSVIIMFLK